LARLIIIGAFVIDDTRYIERKRIRK
jgi:hypothetical protein